MEANKVLKYLWEKYHGKTSEVYRAIKDKEDLDDPETVKKVVEKFDARYDSMDILSDEYRTTIGPRIEPTTVRTLPILIRWNKSAGAEIKDKIISGFENNLFILDDDICRYHIPSNIQGFGYKFIHNGTDTGVYEIYCINNDAVVLSTDNNKELLDFALCSCKYLLIGNKDSDVSIIKRFMVTCYLTELDQYERLIAAPGPRGCYANTCLKTIPQVHFVDCRDDIYKLTHPEATEEEDKEKEEGGKKPWLAS